jgi:hypothetical protein
MITTITFILVGGALGYLLGMTHGQAPTDIQNHKRVEKENQELQAKVDRYKKVIQELIDDNRRLAKELER